MTIRLSNASDVFRTIHDSPGGLGSLARAVQLAGPLDGGNQQNIPGLSTFKGLVLGVIPWALVACVFAFIIGAAFWAVGSFSGNSQHSGAGKKTLMISLVAALLVGAAAVLVGWFNDRGKAVADPIAAVSTSGLTVSGWDL